MNFIKNGFGKSDQFNSLNSIVNLQCRDVIWLDVKFGAMEFYMVIK